MYFNSRPSARGDRADVDAACRHNISIHAPPRGATHGDVEKVPQLFISIHAPPRGATAFPASVCPFPVFQFTPLREGRRKHGVSPIKPGIFQFTPLREGRRTLYRYLMLAYIISIHAPPRGATRKELFEQHMMEFQFTPLREGRLRRLPPSCPSRTYFNSRPSARGDRGDECDAQSQKISIHAPPRGATAQSGRN